MRWSMFHAATMYTGNNCLSLTEALDTATAPTRRIAMSLCSCLLLSCVSAAALVHGPSLRTSPHHARHSQPLLNGLPLAHLEHLSPAVAAALTERLRFVGTTLPVASAAISTRGSSGLPQIVESVRDRVPPPARFHFGDALVYLSRITYHARMGFPVAMWSELVLLLVQNMACLALRYRYVDSKSSAPLKSLARLARDCGCLTVAGLAMLRLPARWMPLLCLWTVPLALFCYGQQAMRMAARGAIAPAPTSTSVLLRWITSSVRVCTTVVFLGADLPVLANHLVGLCGTSVLLFQFQWYAGIGVSRSATRKALYAELFGKQPLQPAGATSWPMRTLAWDSLGGFDGDSNGEDAIDGKARYASHQGSYCVPPRTAAHVSRSAHTLASTLHSHWMHVPQCGCMSVTGTRALCVRPLGPSIRTATASLLRGTCSTPSSRRPPSPAVRSCQHAHAHARPLALLSHLPCSSNHCLTFGALFKL